MRRMYAFNLMVLAACLAWRALGATASVPATGPAVTVQAEAPRAQDGAAEHRPG